jgi:GDP-L-fucose synthase
VVHGVITPSDLIGREAPEYERECIGEPLEPLDRSTRIYVAGHRGRWRSALAGGISSTDADLISATSGTRTYGMESSLINFFKLRKPQSGDRCGRSVGGIHANDTLLGGFPRFDNLRNQVNVMDAANEFDVDRLLFLGSSCIYPKFADQPIKVIAAHRHPRSPRMMPMRSAKSPESCRYRISQTGLTVGGFSAMPRGLYGPGDNFHSENSRSPGSHATYP